MTSVSHAELHANGRTIQKKKSDAMTQVLIDVLRQKEREREGKEKERGE